MKARVHVGLKPSVLDPQGKTIQQALGTLGHASVSDVRQGKYFDLTLEARSPEDARREVEAIAAEVLSNPVIESYSVELLD